MLIMFIAAVTVIVIFVALSTSASNIYRFYQDFLLPNTVITIQITTLSI